MSAARDKSVYTTADLRKSLGDALGKAHFQREVVSILHHGKPYAVVASDQAREALNAMMQLENENLSINEFGDWLGSLVEGGRSLGEIVEIFEAADTESKSAPASSHSTTRRGKTASNPT